MTTPNSRYEDHPFVVAGRFRDMPDAFLFKSILDSAAIECFLADENTIRMNWFWSNLLGGIKLCVRERDVDTATSLLAQPVLESFDLEGIGEYHQPRCPNCKSLEVSFTGLNKPADFTRALLGGPRPLHRRLWQCVACGEQWPESNDKPAADFLTTASTVLMVFLVVETLLVELFLLMEALKQVAF